MFPTRILAALLTVVLATSSSAQVLQTQPAGEPAGAGQTTPLTITLQDALQRARAVVPQFLEANTEAAIAHQDRVQARAAMLPTLSYATSYLYTQGNGTPSGVFIANNAVHEPDRRLSRADVFGRDLRNPLSIASPWCALFTRLLRECTLECRELREEGRSTPESTKG